MLPGGVPGTELWLGTRKSVYLSMDGVEVDAKLFRQWSPRNYGKWTPKTGSNSKDADRLPILQPIK